MVQLFVGSRRGGFVVGVWQRGRAVCEHVVRARQCGRWLLWLNPYRGVCCRREFVSDRHYIGGTQRLHVCATTRQVYFATWSAPSGLRQRHLIALTPKLFCVWSCTREAPHPGEPVDTVQSMLCSTDKTLCAAARLPTPPMKRQGSGVCGYDSDVDVSEAVPYSHSGVTTFTTSGAYRYHTPVPFPLLCAAVQVSATVCIRNARHNIFASCISRWERVAVPVMMRVAASR